MLMHLTCQAFIEPDSAWLHDQLVVKRPPVCRDRTIRQSRHTHPTLCEIYMRINNLLLRFTVKSCRSNHPVPQRQTPELPRLKHSRLGHAPRRHCIYLRRCRGYRHRPTIHTHWEILRHKPVLHKRFAETQPMLVQSRFRRIFPRERVCGLVALPKRPQQCGNPARLHHSSTARHLESLNNTRQDRTPLNKSQHIHNAPKILSLRSPPRPIHCTCMLTCF
mmetsp:Transcript_13922/g.22730  ORF Transcript_13922/g.22730 Transcript_13922/m.22730 type:complete len:220 (-) Transcript_13922:96-755(-)